MNIDELTIREAKELAKMFSNPSTAKPASPLIGEKCIIRTYASGVHFGEVAHTNDRRVDLLNARRLWRWDAAPHGISLSEIANHGTVGARSKVCEVTQRHTILDALEIIPCKGDAIAVIESAEVYKP
jgi:hypothetical protein